MTDYDESCLEREGENMTKLFDWIGTLIIGIAWLTGIVIAKGFWSTLFAIAIPFYAWYLVIERYLV